MFDGNEGNFLNHMSSFKDQRNEQSNAPAICSSVSSSAICFYDSPQSSINYEWGAVDKEKMRSNLFTPDCARTPAATGLSGGPLGLSVKAQRKKETNVVD